MAVLLISYDVHVNSAEYMPFHEWLQDVVKGIEVTSSTYVIKTSSTIEEIGRTISGLLGRSGVWCVVPVRDSVIGEGQTDRAALSKISSWLTPS